MEVEKHREMNCFLIELFRWLGYSFSVSKYWR